MKIALCLFGLVGGSSGKNGAGEEIDPSIAHGYIKKHILDKNDVDVFIHTWSVGKKDVLLDLYDPVRYIFEPQVIFDDRVEVQRARSRWASTRKSVDLIGGDYDMVMLSRMDVAYFADIVFDDYDPKYFYASHWNDVGKRNHHTHGFLDLWLYIDNYDISQHVASKQHAKFIKADVRHAMYRGYDFEMVRRAILKCKK